MKRIIIASAVMILIAAITAQAQMLSLPASASKNLGVYVGTWTGKGKIEVTTLRSKTEFFTATTSCAWSPNAPQVVCEEESGLLAVGTSKGFAVFSYVPQKKQYQTWISRREYSRIYYFGTVEGSVWTYGGSFTAAGNTYQSRMIFNFTSPNECAQKIEYSEDGRIWNLDAEIKWIRE